MTEQQPKIVMHLDLDSFYPSVEMRHRPELKGLPVVVGANPKEGKGRGVVLSCSYEARRFGVHSGQPISRAFRLCPSAVFLPPNFHLYGTTSARIMNLLRNHCNKFEQTSIDEAFLDITTKAGNYDEARKLVIQMKEEIFRTEGLTCSIGIAQNKSAAKIASDLEKPDGLVVVGPGQVADFLAPLPVSVITGVGEKTRRFLKGRGIESIGQLQMMPGRELVKFFGKGGVWLWGVAHGLEQVEVVGNKPIKSLSVEHTFEEDISSWKVLMETLGELAAELHRRVEMGNFEFKTVAVKVRFEHFQTFTRERTLEAHTGDERALLSESAALFGEFKHDKRKVRLVGLRVSNLRKAQLKGFGLEAWMGS
jgi:DNA polymerase IV (DinB-like DNA polymerase)